MRSNDKARLKDICNFIPDNHDLKVDMQKIIELFENDRFAQNAGIKIIEAKPGYAKCSMLITDNHLNGIGILMGGATFTLADYTFSLAANSYDKVAVTLNANISYLRPCSKGTVTAIAEEITRTNSIGTYKIDVVDEEQKLIAQVTGTCHFRA